MMRVFRVVGRVLGGHQAVHVRPLLAQLLRQGLPRAVLADDAGDGRLRAEGAQVVDDVGRAAGDVGVPVGVHHHHRRFRRDAADPAPDVLIQHDIADDQDALPDEGVQYLRARCFCISSLTCCGSNCR